ncbi:MAG: coenzyme synthetase, partial [Vicinamibacteria bacterium]|nr:coenzyme synthetase [Vicinamibacteria bacterium]
MDGVSAPRIAPAARLRRETTSQRAYLPRIEQTIEDYRRLVACRDDAARRAALDARLADLRSALAGSPYYRRVFSAHGLASGELQHLSALSHFPILARATLACCWQEIPSLDGEDRESAGLVVVKSSGSTGAPVSVVRDRYECLHMWAVLRFFLEWLGIALPARPRVALLCSLP